MTISDFTKAENLSIIRGTTNIDGKHDRYLSAIFLPQIHTNNTAQNGAFCSFIEFAVRLRDRTKAEFIRTNKIRRSISVVDTLPLPKQGDTSNTKNIEKNPMKTPQKQTALSAGNLSKPVIQETFALSQHLPKCGQICYSSPAVAKSTAEPENSNNQTLANSSTPFNRAFFVRSTRTPKENSRSKNGFAGFLSMVACSGKGSPFAVFQSSQFSSPLHVTAQTLESLAVAPQNLTLELSAMMYQFIFAAIRRTDLTNQIHKIRISATSELEARKALARDFVLVLAGRINLQNNAKTDRTFSNQGLPVIENDCNIRGTTTVTGHRTRKTCGIFVSQISPNGLLPYLSKFAIRLISRDKADSIRTNKASRVTAVVETVSHLSAIYLFNNLLKTVTAMKNSTQTLIGTTATTTPIVLSSRFEGVQYA